MVEGAIWKKFTYSPVFTCRLGSSCRQMKLIQPTFNKRQDKHCMYLNRASEDTPSLCYHFFQPFTPQAVREFANVIWKCYTDSILKHITVRASTTSSGNLFQVFTTLFEKTFSLTLSLACCFCNLRLLPPVPLSVSAMVKMFSFFIPTISCIILNTCIMSPLILR